MAAPLVSAILTFADSRRLSLARKVVNQFIRQHYTPYELLIVNGTDARVVNNDNMETDVMRASGCQLTEVHVPSNLNSATMKNHGLRIATGEWVICLDDDDYFHPDRLLYQMAHHREGQPCLLRYQLRVDISNGLQRAEAEAPFAFQPLLHLLQQNNGIPGTMLFPRLSPHGQVWQFSESLNTGEYEELLSRMAWLVEARTVCDNMHNTFVQDRQWPLLSIAFYHGNNELTQEQFFPRGQAAERGQVPAGLNALDMAHLKFVLQMYNFAIL